MFVSVYFYDAGSMIDEMVISFNSTNKQTSWFDYLMLKCEDDPNRQLSEPKTVKSATMPAQVMQAICITVANNRTVFYWRQLKAI